MSAASLPYRLELRPSRWLFGALLAMAGLIPVAVLVSEMPRGFAWIIALLGMVLAMRLAMRERKRAPAWLSIDAAGDVRIDDRLVTGFDIDWRGPLAFLHWRDLDGQALHWSLWPDTLPPPQRRELRLAMLAVTAVRTRAAMAP